MKHELAALITGTAVCLAPVMAAAHVGVAGIGYANTTQEVSFSVGHGCGGFDTYSVRVDIPAGVTSVRAMTSDFGRATIAKDAAQAVTSVTWQKPLADLTDTDQNYYKLTLRLKVPNTPFTTINFPAHQTCRAPNGTETVVDWVAVAGAAGEPAPELKILPARRTGWNKYTVPAAIADLNTYFSDAVIVWKGTQAFSASADTAALIKTTAGVQELTALAAGDEVWVRY